MLGADDFLFARDTLLNANKFLASLADDVLIAYGKVNVIDNEENFLYTSGDEWWRLSKLFKSRMSIPHQGVFHRAGAFAKFGLFNTRFKYAGDYEFILRILNNHPPLYMQMTIAGYRFTGGSSKVMTALKVQKEYRLSQKINSYPFIK